MTRPEPGATETASRLDALGYRPVLAPVVRIRPMRANLPEPRQVAAVLVTSGQAIQSIPDSYHGARLFAVGDATALRARQAGFVTVVSAGGDAGDLVATITEAVAPKATLLLVTGRRLGNALAASLRGAGFSVIRRSVYVPVPVRRLPAPALRTIRSGMLRAALFFSADTATQFTAMIERAALRDCVGNTDAVAISKTAAVPLEGLPWRRILVAARPNQDAMLALLR